MSINLVLHFEWTSVNSVEQNVSEQKEKHTFEMKLSSSHADSFAACGSHFKHLPDAQRLGFHPVVQHAHQSPKGKTAPSCGTSLNSAKGDDYFFMLRSCEVFTSYLLVSFYRTWTSSPSLQWGLGTRWPKCWAGSSPQPQREAWPSSSSPLWLRNYLVIW